MVMSQSLIKAIKNRSPKTIIDVIAPSWSLPISQRMSEVNKTIRSPSQHGKINLKDTLSLSKKIRSNSYDEAIILPRSIKSALIPWLAKIPIRTGFRGEMRYFLINNMQPFDHKLLDQTVKRYIALCGREENEGPKNLYPKLEVDQTNKQKILKDRNIQENIPSIGLIPGAEYGPAKKWPTSYFADVASKYLSNGWQVILLGSKNDKKDAEDIKHEINSNNENLVDLTGETSLLDAIDVLSFLDLVLTNDSGLMHVAAAVNTPLVALYGPTSPEFTPPLTEKAITIRKTSGYSNVRRGNTEKGYHSSLIELKPNEVITELNNLITKYLKSVDKIA